MLEEPRPTPLAAMPIAIAMTSTVAITALARRV
jgi:hypothetical protein